MMYYNYRNKVYILYEIKYIGQSEHAKYKFH